jgi:hypothetical protein
MFNFLVLAVPVRAGRPVEYKHQAILRSLCLSCVGCICFLAFLFLPFPALVSARDNLYDFVNLASVLTTGFLCKCLTKSLVMVFLEND